MSAFRELQARLVYQRILHGLTRREVAERMGVSKKAVRALEKDLDLVRLSTLRRYCLAVGVVIEYRIAAVADAAFGSTIDEFLVADEVATFVTYPLAWGLRAATGRPSECCGKCPAIEGGGFDCTCKGNPRCTSGAA